MPAPVLPLLRGGPRLRWGVLAPGAIARSFASALHRHTDQRIDAVASRDTARADAFASEHGIARSYGDYRQLVADPAVDIVYVAAPHTHHLPLALLALEHGKHVLVEKPLAASAAEAREIAAAAHRAGRFAMEAMHTRFHPKTSVLTQLLADGAVGEPVLLQAEIGLGGVAYDARNRLFDPALGGGAALDIGVYPLWLDQLVLGRPDRIVVSGTTAATGIEDQFCAVMHHGSALATVGASLRTWTSSHATIAGDAGRIRLDSRLPLPGSLELIDSANSPISRFDDRSGIVGSDGLCWQAAWAAQHIADGLTESPMHPLARSVDVLETIDEIRRALGAEGAPE